MKDARQKLADLICETLSFCYSPNHRESLSKDAEEMGATYEQFVAMALAERIGENFSLKPKLPPSPRRN